MGDSPVIEVLIGLVVVYLTLSIVCSAAIEALASSFGWRAETLRTAIGRLLGEPTRREGVVEQIGALVVRVVQSTWWQLTSVLKRGEPPKPPADKSPSSTIYAHPLIRALSPDEKRGPSYIPNETFADALIDSLVPASAGPSAVGRVAALAQVLRPQDEANVPAAAPAATATVSVGALSLTPEARSSLRALFERAAAGAETGAQPADILAAFRREIVDWYQRTMDRATGWYRRHTQVWLFAIAALVVVATNADTIRIVDQLAKNPEIRAALVAEGELIAQERRDAATKQDTEPADSKVTREMLAASAKEMSARIDKSGLALGWSTDGWPAPDGASWLSKIAGLLLTVFAVALGSPFWFQVLEKLVKLRASGSRITGASTTDAVSEAKDGPATTAVVGAVTSAGGVTVAAARSTTAPKRTPRLDAAYWSARAAARGTTPPELWPRVGTAANGALLARRRASHAAECARLAALAYDSESVLATTLPALGYADPKFHSVRGSQAFIATVGKDVVVAFRGTEPSEIEDLVADARSAFVPGAFGTDKTPVAFGQVHGGFRHALLQVRAEMDDDIAGRVKVGAKRIFFTGHSLGGALATLYFAHQMALGTDCEMYLTTFGSPRVGDAKFIEALVAQCGQRHTILRVVNDRDLVTRVAPRAMGYQHVEPVCFLDTLGRVTWDEFGRGEWSRFLAFVVDASADLKKAAREPLEDHAIARYVQKLEAHANGAA